MKVRIRPSKLKQASLCNGSLQLEELLTQNGDIDPQDEEISSLGTLMHGLIATMIHGFKLEKGEPGYDFNVMSKLWQDKHPTLNGYDCWCVFSAYLWFVQLVEDHHIKWDNILIEHHLDGHDLGMSKGGTADVILVTPYKELIIIDWKFGYLQQDEADINDQLAGYAVMGARTFHVEQVFVMIYQARMDEPLSSAEYDSDLLKQSEEWVREVAALAQADDAAITYNYKACYYCDALGRCPEARQKTMDILDAYNQIADAGQADLAECYKAAKLGVRAETNLKGYIKPILEKNPVAIPGLSLKPGNKRTKVEDPESLYMSMHKEGLNFWDVSTVKIGELKKMLGKNHSLLNYIQDDGRNSPSIVID